MEDLKVILQKKTIGNYLPCSIVSSKKDFALLSLEYKSHAAWEKATLGLPM